MRWQLWLALAMVATLACSADQAADGAAVLKPPATSDVVNFALKGYNDNMAHDFTFCQTHWKWINGLIKTATHNPKALLANNKEPLNNLLFELGLVEKNM